MNKLKDNIIFKIIVLLFVTAIMAILVINVYNYYDDLARNKNSTKEEINNQDLTEEESNIQFTLYKNKKTTIKIEDKNLYIDVERTDAGDVFTLDGNALVDVSFMKKIYYTVLDDLLLLKVSYEDYDYLYLINKDFNILGTYKNIVTNNKTYKIKTPIFDDSYKDSVYIKNNDIYITYVLDNYSYVTDPNEVIQYTTKISYIDGSLLDEDDIIKQHKYEEYKEK